MGKKQPREVTNEAPSIGDLLDSRFLRWFDLVSQKDGKYVEAKVKISKVVKEQVFIPNANAKEDKPVLEFEGKQKMLILNKTNTMAIVDKHGPCVKDWVGKEITLYVDPNVKLRGQTVPGIRIK